MKRYCGRDFSTDEIQAMTRLIEQNPAANRAHLSREVCVMFDWKKPNGGLKDMSCRVAMLRMQDDGLIALPASQLRPRRRPEFIATASTDAQLPLLAPVHELGSLTLKQVAGTANSRLWNEYIARYHYLGYTPMAGSQMRYFVFEGERLLALLSFGASVWKLAARDRFIGWEENTRRHRGTCYKAANWINVGKTAGRGKKCHTHKQIIPIKDIWLYPLHKNFRSVLGQ